MLVKLLKSGAPFGFAHNEGEVIEVEDLKALYMIECEAAEAAEIKTKPKK